MEPTTHLTIFRNPEIHDLCIAWHGSNTFSICAQNGDGLLDAASEVDAFTSYGTGPEERPTFEEAQRIAHRHFEEMLHGEEERCGWCDERVSACTRCRECGQHGCVIDGDCIACGAKEALR
jgi:hypothetical protein